MREIIEGVTALDFNPDLVTDNVSVDSSRAVKVSTLFVEKIAALYNKKAGNENTMITPAVEEEVPAEEYQEPVCEPEVSEPEVEVEVEKEIEPVVEAVKEEPVYEVPIKEEITPIDPDGMLSDITSSFEVAVAQIHATKAELEAKEKETDRVRGELLIKEEKANRLLDELEKMKVEVDASKKEADKIIKEAEIQEKALQRRVDAFEAERQKFLNNLKATTGSIMTMVDAKQKPKED